MKVTWRYWLALWIGKGISAILRLLGRKGTTLPGKVALKIEPQLIGLLASDYHEGIVMVTGTNGKTTTANLLAEILKKAGQGFAFNQAGANMAMGIAAAFLQDRSWTGKAKNSLALLEVDEGTVPKVSEQLKPRLVIITNFFADQLDRYGSLETIINLVKDSLPPDAHFILNADDPLVAQLGLGKLHTLYYGVERTSESKTESNEAREICYCPKCGEELSYTLFHYGQLGHYGCLECGYERPQPQVLATDISANLDGITFMVDGKEYNIALQGYYNLYNALAAFTAAKRLGFKEREIAEGLQRFVPQAGRMEQFNLPQGRLTLTLVKNATGLNQVIQTILALKEQPIRLLIGINDLGADGRDISWLKDVNFELLSEEDSWIEEIVCTGLRAEDLATRLQGVGLESKLYIEKDPQKALARILDQMRENEGVFILPNYTLLFKMRKLLEAKQEEGKSLQDEPIFIREKGNG